MAKAESDYTADNFLQWFIKEQLEEVASMGQLLRVVQRAGEGNLLRVEEYLAREKDRGGRSQRGRMIGRIRTCCDPNPASSAADWAFRSLPTSSGESFSLGTRAGKSEDRTPVRVPYFGSGQASSATA